ncbi:MAG: type VI secretion system Vgr family protein [Flavobacteriales bacterium]
MRNTTYFKSPDNAKGIKENHVAGINRLVKLTGVINGKIIKHYQHFKLKQSAKTHHEFELSIPYDALSESQNHQLEEANQFLGNRLTVKITYKDVEESPENIFVGVVTQVGFSQDAHSFGNVVLKGYSPTILLDGAPHTQSFGGNQSVHMGIIAESIIKQGINEGKNEYDISIRAKASSEIMYSTQYNETHYNYLCRMAEAYGEQFYYDGEVLHFGEMPAPKPPLELTYGSNITDVNVELKAVHTKPSFYGYNSSDHAKLTSGETPIKHRSNLAAISYKNNEQIFKTPSLQVAPIKAVTDKDVVNSQTGTSGSQAVEVFTVSGSTSLPFLHPGCVADIKMRKEDSGETTYFTRLMMTEVTHEIDALGHYKGRFEAIASDTGYMPKPKFTVPIAEPQLATVISNNDPKRQGRVTVRFDWQLHDTTNFIRMMAPDAGGSDQVTQNRGYVAIPEVGDQVMVGFVHNHPDRPFVMGGMFHGKVGLGGGENNRVKSIMTRSGHKVVFTEDESIIITDKSGNEIHLDTTGSNINITAPETMTFNCKNMNINVGQNMTTSVGMNKSDTIGMNNTESVGAMKSTSVAGDASMFITGKLTEMIEGDVHSETTKGKTIVNGESGMETVSNGAITKHAQNDINNKSGEKGKSH